MSRELFRLPGGAGLSRRLLALLLALCVVLIGAEPTAAHATFVRSDPAPNATLPTAPAEIKIWFAEPLEPSGSTASLYDAGGKQVAGTRVVFGSDREEMTVTAPANLPASVYTVAWQTLSAADGHELQGYFAFTVGPATTTQTAFAPTQHQGAPGWLQTASRWLALLGLAVALAIWPIWLLVIRPAAPDAAVRATLARRARRFVAWAMVAAVGGSLAALLVQATTLGAARYLDAVWTTATDTRYGRLWWARIGLLAAYALCLRLVDWDRPGRRPALAGAALLLAVLLPVPFSLNTHAAAEPIGTATAVATDALHLLGAALWAGGLVVLLAVLLPPLPPAAAGSRRALLARALPRFSAVALVAWGVLGLSGLYSAWLQVGSLDALRTTNYGLTLVVKLALLVPLLALGAVNLLAASPGIRHEAIAARSASVWVRRLPWTVGAEVALVTVVLLVVGRLTSLEPARAEFAAQHPSGVVMPLVLDPDDAARPANLTIAPGAAGPNQYRLEIAGDPVPPGSDAVLRVSLPALGIGAQEIALTREGPSAFVGSGSELGIAGNWTVETIVRKIGSFSWGSTQTLALRPTPPAAPTPPPAWVFGNGGLPALALVAAGLVAAAIAWLRPARRPGWSGVAALALAAGAIVLLQARIVPAAPAVAGPVVAATPAVAPAAPAPQTVGVLARAMPTAQSTASPAAAGAAAGTPVTRGGLTVTLLPAARHTGPSTVAVTIADGTGAPVKDATVTAIVRSLEMDMGTQSVPARETAPGRYEAADVPLSMSGTWRLTIRVAPQGQASTSFVYDLAVRPGEATPQAGVTG